MLEDKDIIHELLNYYKQEFDFKLKDNIDLLECERNLLAFLMGKGQKMMQLIFDEIGTGYQGKEIGINGKEYFFNDNTPKTVQGLFGPITYKRAYYLSNDDDTPNYIPVDIKLGIKKKHTPACNYFMSLHTGKGPYQESLDHFHEIFRPNGINYISLAKAENMDRELGKKIETVKQNEIKKVFCENEYDIKKEKPIHKIMSVQIDGTGIPHKLEPIKDKNGKLKYTDVSCKEAKSAAISEILWNEERKEAHCINTTYVSAMEEADAVFQRIYVEMLRRCEDLDEMFVVFIGDGAKWIYDRVKTLIPPDRCIFILDFYHANERLSDTAKALYGMYIDISITKHSDISKIKHKKWESQMYEGNIQIVINELNKILPTIKKTTVKETVEKNINYFTLRINQMNYQEYRKKKYPIGSGTIESACKNVIGGRFKQGGMRWAEGNSDAMLQIRCSIKSKRFYNDFKSAISYKQAA